MNIQKILHSFLFSIIFLLVIGAVYLAHTTAVYASYDCSGGCLSEGTWNGTTYGASSNFTISNPSISSGQYFSRSMKLFNSGSNETVYMGIDNGLACSAGALQYYYQVWHGVQLVHSLCINVPSSHFNGVQTLSLNNFVSGQGGMLLHFPVNMGAACNNTGNCFVSGIPQSYGSITVLEDIQKVVNGHWVWGGNWSGHHFVASNGTYNSQTRNFDSTVSYGQAHPVQFYWNTVPSSSNPGGSLYTCDYDTGSTCQLGK